MIRKPKLAAMVNNMPKLALLLSVMLLSIHSLHAIPSSITGNYNVTGPDNCTTTCTIQNGGTLTITGSGANSTFSGSITVMPGGKLIILNGATVKMASGTKIAIKGNNATLNGGYLRMDNGHITSTGSNVFWSGIETSVGSPVSVFNPYPAIVVIGENSGQFSADNLIENAIVGIRNYDSGNPNINATSEGQLPSIILPCATISGTLPFIMPYHSVSLLILHKPVVL